MRRYCMQNLRWLYSTASTLREEYATACEFRDEKDLVTYFYDCSMPDMNDTVARMHCLFTAFRIRSIYPNHSSINALPGI